MADIRQARDSENNKMVENLEPGGQSIQYDGYSPEFP